MDNKVFIPLLCLSIGLLAVSIGGFFKTDRINQLEIQVKQLVEKVERLENASK